MEVEKEFEEFFQYLDKISNSSETEIKSILKPLKYILWKEYLKKILKITLIFVTICFAIYYFDTLNWFGTAIGRICMIKILPLWNWKYLGKSKCLIANHRAATSYHDIDEFNIKDCKTCAYFEQIDVVTETSYSYIYDKYLVRGLPVIISDAIEKPQQSGSLLSFIDDVSVNMSDMINSEACNFESNLMMSKYANLDKAFSILKRTLVDSKSAAALPWFISFRNCKLKALKASRLLIPKPYFYPINLQAPYTTWLLMSQKYEHSRNILEVYGLVIVTQIKGSIKILLEVNDKCEKSCKNLIFTLFAGESLVLLSNTWTLSYEFLNEYDFSITFITETHLY